MATSASVRHSNHSVRDSAGKKFKSGADAGGDPDAARQAETRRTASDEVQGVFVIQNGKAEWTPVIVGITGGEYFEVTRGLKGGETIVAGSFQAVRELEDGDPVRTPVAAAGNAKGKR